MGGEADAMTFERSAAEDLLYREAWCLDNKCWEDWLALYTEDAVYWRRRWTGTRAGRMIPIKMSA